MNLTPSRKAAAIFLTLILGGLSAACGDTQTPSQAAEAAAHAFDSRALQASTPTTITPSRYQYECGDGICEVGEDSSCSTDCDVGSYCGDGLCSFGEEDWCSQDCGFATCGNGICEGSEADWCSVDCGYTTVCGDGYCSASESCSLCEQDCGACPVNVPGVPQQGSMSDLHARAATLGVSPLMAGVPNIEAFLENYPGGNTNTLYPTGSTGLQDFMNKLFQGAIWSNQTPGQTVVQSQTDAAGCQMRQIDERFNPEDLVTFDMGAGLLYPSALNQGAYLNTGVGSLTPIHVPAPQRKPVKLVGTFYQVATAPTASSSDVYNSIGQLIKAANTNGGVTQSTVYFDMQSASSLEEAAVKFKLDAKLFGAGVSTIFNSSSSGQTNTVFVRFTQSLFAVFQDLGGFTPTLGQFNSSNFTVQDLNRLGDMGEVAYDNLPTYVRAVTYGRMLLFSISSSTTKSELEAAVNAVYGPFSASATATQKSIVQNSQFRLFAYGGVADPALAAIKSGDWKDYFSLEQVPLASLKPLSYEVRRFDDQLAVMSRATRYTERVCPQAHSFRLEISDAYREAQIFHRSGGSGWAHILSVNGDGAFDLTPYLTGNNDEIKIGNIVGKPDVWTSYNGRVTWRIYVDGVLLHAPPRYSCRTCHSQDIVAYSINKYAGTVTNVGF